MLQFCEAAPQLKELAPPPPPPSPTPTETWTLAWNNEYKKKLVKFSNFFDDDGCELVAGALFKDDGFNNLATDAAERRLVAEVTSRKRKGEVVHKTQSYSDVST